MKYFPRKKQRFIYLVNENSSPIKIEEIKSINEYATLEYEKVEYLGNDEPITYDRCTLYNFENNIKKNLLMPNRCKKMPTSIIIQPYSAIKFSINLNPNINDNTKIKGKNTIIYNNNSKFVIENTAYIFKGSFEIIQNNIKFEPAFPSIVQKIFIECQNTMELPISLYTAKSTDDRIIASLIIYEIFSEKKTKIYLFS